MLSTLLSGGLNWLGSQSAQSLIASVILPLLLALAWHGVQLMKQRGYRTAYVEALLRALGAGEQAAKDAGTTLLSEKGRIVGMVAAVDYLRSTVDKQAIALGIVTEADHALRLDAQLNAMQLQARITAKAGSEVVRPGDEPYVSGQGSLDDRLKLYTK